MANFHSDIFKNNVFLVLDIKRKNVCGKMANFHSDIFKNNVFLLLDIKKKANYSE